ncbi:MAG: hypothetical protein P8127_00175 [Acidobacteriota bacterium]
MRSTETPFRTFLAKCAAVPLGLGVASAGIVAAADQVFLEAGTLARDGARLTVVLPNGRAVLSSAVVGACLSDNRSSGDVLKIDLETSVCQFIPDLERDAAPVLHRPVVHLGEAGDAATILECLAEHRGVLLLENSEIALCFDWYHCGDLAPVITGADSVCAGSSIPLDAGSGFDSYLWEPGGETTQTIDASPGVTTQYAVTVTDQWLCSGADTHLVTVVPLPKPTITGPTTVCQGSSVTLDAGAGYAAYLWSPGGQTTQQIQVSPVVTTGYTVMVTDGQGCDGVSAQHMVDVTICSSSIFADDFETGGTSQWSLSVP